MPTPRHKRIAAGLTEWFGRNARDLPWRRSSPREPYLSLVSEAMLQQTQVSRVLEKFDEFVARFPTIGALAAAPEQAVLAAWSGLGYYRRARNLHRAARAIVERHCGRVPDDLTALRALPGVGDYTAGAIASIVFNQAVPAVDANARRVILRLEGRESASVSNGWVKECATELVRAAPTPRPGPAALNEALMELGALVCSAASPACERCPLKRMCRARAAGNPGALRSARPKAQRVAIYHSCLLVGDSRGRLLAQARPSIGPGLWSGLWQPPTLERADRHAHAAEIRRTFGVQGLARIARFSHTTSHRLVHFEVWRARPARTLRGAPLAHCEYRSPEEIAHLPLASPHRRIFLTLGSETRG